jgi:hypothetical protein
MRNWNIYAIAFLASLPLTVPTFADKVSLDNGDSLQGTVVSMTKETLLFKTDAMGEISIKKDSITSLETNDSQSVELKSKETLNAALQVSEQEKSLNIEDQTIELSDISAINRPADKWSGKAGLNMSNFSGNSSDKDTFKGTLELKRPFTVNGDPHHELALKGSLDFRKNNNHQVKTRKGNFSANLQNNLSKRAFWNIITRVKWDDSRDLRVRFVEGVGVGYTLIEDYKDVFTFGVGIDFARIDSYYDLSDNEGFFSLRPGYKWDCKIYEIKEDMTITLGQKFKYSPNLSDLDDFNFVTETALTIPLHKDVKLKISQGVEYDSQPVPGVLKRDREWKTEITYDF